MRQFHSFTPSFSSFFLSSHPLSRRSKNFVASGKDLINLFAGSPSFHSLSYTASHVTAGVSIGLSSRLINLKCKGVTFNKNSTILSTYSALNDSSIYSSFHNDAIQLSTSSTNSQVISSSPSSSSSSSTTSSSSSSPSSPSSSSSSSSSSQLNVSEIESRVIDRVRKFEKVDGSKVNIDSVFGKDLGLDSLDSVELIMEFEDEFDIVISDADADTIVSVKDAVDFIKKQPQAR